MSFQELLDYLQNTQFLGVTLITYLYLLIIALVSITLERAITRYLRRFAKRARLTPNVTNSLGLTFRLLILIGATYAVVRLGGLPTDWLIYFSTVGGVALGFASTKTVGNFIAGLYLFAAKPFRVGDYVRIGTVEGIVEEITINYTKIWTIGNNIVSIANLQIMDRDVANFLYESDDGGNLYCYTFEIAFDHSVSSTKTAEILNEVFKLHEERFAKKPSYMILRSGGFERVYMIYIYVRNPEDIFTLRTQIAEEAFVLWDKERAKQKA
jgi:small-conductance mechanosensitive channel